MSTYLIRQSHISHVFSMQDYLTTVEHAFRLQAEDVVQMPPKVYLSFPSGDARCMPVYIPSLQVAGIKNVTVFPENKQHPTVMGTITLLDADTGYPLAILDGTLITNMRTGAAGGVAIKYLAKETIRELALIGAGRQAMTQLEAARLVRPDIQRVRVYDLDAERVRQFTEAVHFDCEIQPFDSVEEAVHGTDVVVTTTPSRSPVLSVQQVSPGTHINAIGADAAGKQELDPEILTQAYVVIDNWEQASHSGEINVPLRQGVITRDSIGAEIGAVVTGRKPGRMSDDQITVFDSTGLATQDIVTAKGIYDAVMDDEPLRSTLHTCDFNA